MLIEIQCSELGEYDPSTGRSSVCGQRMMVDSNQVGQAVICPKCNQQLIVELPKQSAKKSGAQPVAATQGKPAPSGASAQSRPRKRASQIDAPVKTDVMDVAFDQDQIQHSHLGGHAQTCKKCGNPAPYGRCRTCRYVEPRYAKMHMPLDKIKMQLSGMQLWFCKTLQEGMSVGVLATISHVVVGFLCLAMFFFAGLQIFNSYLVWGGITLTVALAIAVFYGTWVYKGYQFLSNPRAKLSFSQASFWFLVLQMARLGKWENYDSRLKDRRVIKVKEKGFTDNMINQLEGIRNVQVLDLENTQVTDQGVALLYRLEHLQCVVLRRTNVTHDAVVRLQQTFPKLWIWY